MLGGWEYNHSLEKGYNLMWEIKEVGKKFSQIYTECMYTYYNIFLCEIAVENSKQAGKV